MKTTDLTPLNSDQVLRLKEKASETLLLIQQRLAPIMGTAAPFNATRVHPWPWNDIVMTGGWFCATYHGHVPNDIDIYILNKPASLEYFKTILDILQFNYVTNTQGPYIWKSKGLDYFKNKNILEVYTLDGHKIVGEGFPNIQFIFSTYETREAILSDFDYKHCTISYCNGSLFITPAAWDAMVNKKLVVNNREMITPKREIKFIDAGFNID